MGRKSKPPVEIDSSSSGTDVLPMDGLPPFKRFIDIDGMQHSQKILTRLFFVTPSNEEVTDTVQKHQSNEVRICVIGGWMPYMPNGRISPPLFEHSRALGFTEAFSTDVVRLAISHLQGKHLGRNSVSNAETALRKLVCFLAASSERPQAVTDISRAIWTDYVAFCAADGCQSSEILFNTARLIFHNYAPTSLSGRLDGLKFKAGKRRKPSKEHTSPLAETRDYTNVVMYQLLCLFIYVFELRIGFLKHYENVRAEDMPSDWVYPGRKAKYGKRGTPTDAGQLIRNWLLDETAGYQVLIDHHIMHHKAGLIKRNRAGHTRGAGSSHSNDMAS
jgi:hypothetical protein